MAATFLLTLRVRHVYFISEIESSIDQCEIGDGGNISTSV